MPVQQPIRPGRSAAAFIVCDRRDDIGRVPLAPAHQRELLQKFRTVIRATVKGNLVVAAYADFVEFSDYGVEYKVYPKMAAEATENIIFDALGNLYTTTSTGGTDKLNQYSAKDYVFKQTIALPPGAGQLTGITFDGSGRLYVASQTGNTIHVSDVNTEFEVFSWVKKLSGAGNPGNFEGLQFNATGELVAAAGDLVRYNVETTNKIGTFDAPNDLFPVPLRVDNSGNIYTSDYENGVGTLPADIFKFNSQGELIAQANDPGLFGPFGLALSGTVLAGDPPVEWTYQLAASDPDGDPLNILSVQSAVNGTVSMLGGQIVFTPTPNYNGPASFTYTVSDGHGGTATSTVNIGVNPVVDGNLIRLPFPDLSKERRQEFVKTAHRLAEEGRVHVRNVRRDGMDNLKTDENKKEISEDEERRAAEVHGSSEHVEHARDDVGPGASAGSLGNLQVLASHHQRGRGG